MSRFSLDVKTRQKEKNEITNEANLTMGTLSEMMGAQRAISTIVIIISIMGFHSLLKIMTSKPRKDKLTAILIVVLLIALPMSGYSRSEEIEELTLEKSLVHSEKNLLATVLPEFEFQYSVFSPDGKQVAYVARKGKEQFVVVGEDMGEGFDFVASLMFRPHDNQFTYLALKGGKEFLVVGDSRIQLNYPYLEDAVLSHDGKQLAYIAQTPYRPGEPQKKFIVVGDRKGEEFTFVRPLVFSPNGRSVAYAACNLDGVLADIGKWCIVVDGVKRKTRYSYIDSLTFSPDGRQLAYVVRKPGKSLVVVGDKEGEEFDFIYEPLVFSPNGTQIAYNAREGEKDFIVKGGKKGEEFDGVAPPVYSPNGKKFAYRAVKRVRGKSTQFVIIGDKKDEAFDPIFGSPVVFSPDSSQVAYKARKGKEMFIVVGDKLSEEFDRIDHPVFSSDGKEIAFGAKKGNKLLWNVIPVGR